MKTIPELLDELSFLSRETTGASFVIQHSKSTGLWKVVFNNAMVQLKNDPIMKESSFEEAIEKAIDWLKLKRKPVDIPIEKYTIY